MGCIASVCIIRIPPFRHTKPMHWVGIPSYRPPRTGRRNAERCGHAGRAASHIQALVTRLWQVVLCGYRWTNQRFDKLSPSANPSYCLVSCLARSLQKHPPSPLLGFRRRFPSAAGALHTVKGAVCWGGRGHRIAKRLRCRAGAIRQSCPERGLVPRKRVEALAIVIMCAHAGVGVIRCMCVWGQCARGGGGGHCARLLEHTAQSPQTAPSSDIVQV